jgi:hypothetical protein
MDKIVQRRQNSPIRMRNLQLLRKALVNRGDLLWAIGFPKTA